MKKISILSVFISLLLLQSCIIGDWNKGISGNGEVSSEIIDITGFTGVKASSGIDVNISQGDYNVELVADENLHDYITVVREGNMLVVGSERNIYKAKSKLVHVTLPELTDIKISSAGDIEAKTDFVCDELDISISSAGDLDLGVEASSIQISISSSGDCEIYGSCERLEAKLSSAGDLNAFDLDADYVDVNVSSAGDASVTANEEIRMTASSAGNIYYKGNAKVVKSHTSSAGSIIKR